MKSSVQKKKGNVTSELIIQDCYNQKHYVLFDKVSIRKTPFII